MSERFTEILRAASEPSWSDAVGHRFVNELFAGSVPDAVMARYLIQDHRFLDSFLILLGAALASADTDSRYNRCRSSDGATLILQLSSRRRTVLPPNWICPTCRQGRMVSGPLFIGGFEE